MWDPAIYREFADERGRAFAELTARVGAEDPGLVADIGCGPGRLTAALARRWPRAEVCGVDSSAEMISAARELQSPGGRLTFTLGDARDWQPDRAPDVIVANSVLQWLPDYEDVLRRWACLLAPGGWVAIQVPGNYDQPSHLVLRELAASDRWRHLLGGVRLNRQTADPAGYLDILASAGCAADTWESTYLHVLHGSNPVLDWYRGSGLRPVLAALDQAQAEEFAAAYGERLLAAYPQGRFGTVLAFRRVFAVGHRG